jgi:predicted N-formylglutamate amidohydrolase
MLEIRNDLIVTPDQQAKMADMLASWISQAFTSLQTHKVVQC